MSAIITDQLRILNAKNFVAAATTSENSFYSFVGLPNPTDYNVDWDVLPPAPKDNFDEENNYWDTAIALKRIKEDDVRQVIRKIEWVSGETYDMYRHDISRTNPSKPSGGTNLYFSNFYIVNSDYQVYICLFNGTDPENPEGRPSLNEPQFTDLEPRSAGDGSDGYIWKYLYTIKPSDILKFESTEYIPVPKNWETNASDSLIRNNASTSGQLKIITITDRGIDLGAANRTYSNIPIKGDGSGAQATITINNDSRVESVIVSVGGSGYTYGTLDLSENNFPQGTSTPTFDIIIPPKGGHGFDIYRELGAYNVLIYSRIENDIENPDFITGNQISRIGIIENPTAYKSTQLLSEDKASAVYAIKLGGNGYGTAEFTPDSYIYQDISTGSTAVGRVVSYDKATGVIKYWQDRSLAGFNTDGTHDPIPMYGYDLNRFTATPSDGGSLSIQGGSIPLTIDTSFTGISTIINSKKYYLGQYFTLGVSTPEVEKYSGNIIYVDNRPAITRSTNQKEDIKVVLQF